MEIPYLKRLQAVFLLSKKNVDFLGSLPFFITLPKTKIIKYLTLIQKITE
jgi:hypothetical protein